MSTKNRFSFSQGKDIGLLLLRLTFGGIMLFNHGWPKLMKFFQDGPIQFADLFGIGASASLALAVFSEAFCGLLIALGLFTREAAIPLIITMFIAAFYIHFDDPFENKEMAILYLTPYIAIFLMGPGKFSLDRMMGRE